MSMGIFDFLKSDKKKAHEAADKAREQVEEKGAATPTVTAGPGSSMGGKYVDAAEATKAAAERMAAAPPRHASHTPTPGSAAHKSVAAAPEPPAARTRPAPPPAVHAPHTPTPGSAAHKSVAAAPVAAKRAYTVRAGDSLAEIARRELGNEARWRELYAMNRGVIGSNPDLIRPGMVLTLPH
ncbi:LysM peptidoglycan-binding domain-containing protein [Streptomyces goshikiensis]|uniref:LysM peptidoglycan-binding domain-containing protein n=1 Tax=Streptomyces goshikiensis TaxID=1942 RepID=UPI00365F4396